MWNGTVLRALFKMLKKMGVAWSYYSNVPRNVRQNYVDADAS
jgi:hypothetical protein